jgi:hypothetical protein
MLYREVWYMVMNIPKEFAASIFRSLRLCWWITTSVVLFCKDGWFSTSVTLRCVKPLNKPNLLIPYEQYYIQTLHREGKLIPEQYPGETNPLFQMAINPSPHIPHEQNSSASACKTNTTKYQPQQKLQHTTNWGMYCTISNSHNKVHKKGTKYQTTNEKYHTQTNTMVTKA